MNITKEVFLQEVSGILSQAQNNEKHINITNTLDYLYQVYERIGKFYTDNMKIILFHDDKERKKVLTAVDDVMEYLFSYRYDDKDIYIPYSFLKGPVGRVIGTVLYGVSERTFTTAEIAQITGFTTPYINKVTNAGDLKGYLRGGIWIYYETDVITFLRSKNIPLANLTLT